MARISHVFCANCKKRKSYKVVTKDYIVVFIGILILEFKTFKSLLIVLSVIPLGLIGAVLMLFVAGQPMSFVAIIGLIALVGIEINIDG